MVVLAKSATCEGWDGVGGCDWAKFLSCQCQIKNPCEAIKLNDLPQNLPMKSFKKSKHSCGVNVKAHGLLPFTLGFFILNELESQTIHGHPS
jgi:hypothetical protein